MAKRHLLSSTARGSFFDIPSDIASLERYYVLATDDLDLISSRRGAGNRLGLAIHIALLRHPGQGWRDKGQIPPEVIHWLTEQIHVSISALDIHGHRKTLCLIAKTREPSASKTASIWLWEKLAELNALCSCWTG